MPATGPATCGPQAAGSTGPHGSRELARQRGKWDLRFAAPGLEEAWLAEQPAAHRSKDVLFCVLLILLACSSVARAVGRAGACIGPRMRACPPLC